MEPFNLSLQQVNFEEIDITDSDTLYPFSNLVCFDSDFKEEKSPGAPVTARQVTRSATSGDQSSLSSGALSEEEVVQLIQPEYPVGLISPHGAPARRHGESMAIEPNEDSFVGFTDTVQALALQKSVIGKSNVKPASNEEIARVIAETKRKLSETVTETSNTTSSYTQQMTISQSVTSNLTTVEKETLNSYAYTEAHSSSLLVTNGNTSSSSDSAKITSSSADQSQTTVKNPQMKDKSPSYHKIQPNLGKKQSKPTKKLIQIPHDQLTISHDRKNSKSNESPHDSPKHSVNISPKPSPTHNIDVDIKSEKKSNLKRTKKKSSSSPKHSSPEISRENSSVDVFQAVEEMKTLEKQVVGENDTIISQPTSSNDVESSEIRENSESTMVLNGINKVETMHVRSSNVISVKNIQEHVYVNYTSPETKENSVVDGKNNVDLPKPVDSPGHKPERRVQSTPGNTPKRSPEHLSSDYDKLLREKAMLEGKVEILEAESSQILKARAQLQAQVATLIQQVQTQDNTERAHQAERTVLVADLESIKQRKTQLEMVIIDAHKLLEDKDNELRTLGEDLGLSHKANQKLHEKIKDLNETILGKEGMVHDMKGKITELYVDLQMSNQNRVLLESENKSFQSEIKSLTLAKEWYQEQLQLSQESKLQLQKEISSLKSEMIAQGTMIERLKADNIHGKQLLADAEQRALSEKEKLAHHLEAIESQMMEREVAFVQIQQQKDSIEATLQHRLDKGKEEISGEIAGELKKAQNELRRRQATISVMEHEQAELRKRITLSQESILERDKRIDTLEKTCVDTEVQLKQTQLSLHEKDEELSQLRDSKLATEVELNAMREEKSTISAALKTLKQDMEKVEASFKHLKQELKSKQDELDQLRSERNKLDTDLTEARRQVEVSKSLRSAPAEVNHIPNVDSYNEADTHEVILLKEQISALQSRDSEMSKRLEGVRSESSLLIEELKSQKSALEQQIGEMNVQIQELQSQVDTDDKDITPSPNVTDFVHSLQSFQHRLSQYGSESSGQTNTVAHNEDQINMLDNLKMEEDKLQVLLSQTLHKTELTLILRNIINVNQHLIKLVETKEISSKTVYKVDETTKNELELAIQENLSLKNELSEIKLSLESKLKELQDGLEEERESHNSTMADLRQQNAQFQADNTALESQLVAKSVDETTKLFQQENSELRSKLAHLETTSHKEIARQQAKSLKFGKDLEAALKQYHEEKRVSEARITELLASRQSLESQKLRLEEELGNVQVQLSATLDDKSSQINEELQSARYELSVTQQTHLKVETEMRIVIQNLETERNQYRSQIDDRQAEIRELQEKIEQQQERENDTRQLILELEREKGRLAGVIQNHSTLKQHTSSLEQALARQESSAFNMSSQIEDELLKKEQEATELRAEIRLIEDKLEAEKQAKEEAKKQHMKEKGSHVKVRRELETLWVEHDQLKSEIEINRQKVAALEEQLGKALESDNKHRSELEVLTQDLRATRAEKDHFMGEIQGQRARDPVLQENIKSLEWQIEEKQAEIEALRSQAKVSEDRQYMEIDMLRKSLQSLNVEVNSLREELLTIKQDKTSLKTRVAELKGALQASIQHTKLLQKSQDPSESPTTTVNFDLSALEKLLQDVTPKAIDSKPLSFLQATLSSLRGEIAGLQSQVDQHASAVQTSSKAWMELEAQVRDLRDVCRTSAEGRAASKNIIQGTDTPPPQQAS